MGASGVILCETEVLAAVVGRGVKYLQRVTVAVTNHLVLLVCLDGICVILTFLEPVNICKHTRHMNK